MTLPRIWNNSACDRPGEEASPPGSRYRPALPLARQLTLREALRHPMRQTASNHRRVPKSRDKRRIVSPVSCRDDEDLNQCCDDLSTNRIWRRNPPPTKQGLQPASKTLLVSLIEVSTSKTWSGSELLDVLHAQQPLQPPKPYHAALRRSTPGSQPPIRETSRNQLIESQALVLKTSLGELANMP